MKASTKKSTVNRMLSVYNILSDTPWDEVEDQTPDHWTNDAAMMQSLGYSPYLQLGQADCPGISCYFKDFEDDGVVSRRYMLLLSNDHGCEFVVVSNFPSLLEFMRLYSRAWTHDGEFAGIIVALEDIQKQLDLNAER